MEDPLLEPARRIVPYPNRSAPQQPPATIRRSIAGKREKRSSLRTPCSRHQMETFSALRALCAGNSPVTGEFSSQRPETRSFDFFL